MVHFKGEKLLPAVMSRGDLLFVTTLFGFFFGFGYFVTWHAINETRRSKRVNAYVILIWSCLIASWAFAILTWLFLEGTVPPGFWTFFWAAFLWAIQTNCLLQIIVNRICLLVNNRQKRLRLKLGVAILQLLITIAVFIIWIPDRLFISERWHQINNVWDRVQKAMFLVVDGFLNWYFIRTVQTRLIDNGLVKYNSLVRFNKVIIGISLSLDALIIGLMSMNNDFVYAQFQCLAYLIKLEIEMATSQLIIKVATSTSIHGIKSTTTAGFWGVDGHTLSIPAEVSVHTQTITKGGSGHEQHELAVSPIWPRNKPNASESEEEVRAVKFEAV